MSVFVVLNNLAFLKILIKFVHVILFFLNENIYDNYKFILNILNLIENHIQIKVFLWLMSELYFIKNIIICKYLFRGY